MTEGTLCLTCASTKQALKLWGQLRPLCQAAPGPLQHDAQRIRLAWLTIERPGRPEEKGQETGTA